MSSSSYVPNSTPELAIISSIERNREWHTYMDWNSKRRRSSVHGWKWMIRSFKKGKYEHFTKLYLSLHSRRSLEAYHKLFRAVKKYLPLFSHLRVDFGPTPDGGIDGKLADLLESYFPQIECLQIENLGDDLTLTCKAIGRLNCLQFFELRQSYRWISADILIALANSLAGLSQLRRINWYERYGGYLDDDDWVRSHQRDDKAYEQLFCAVGGRKNLVAKFELNSQAKLKDPGLMQILEMGPNDQQVLALMASKKKVQSFNAGAYLEKNKAIWVEALVFARDLKDFACFHQLFQKMPIEYWLPDNKKRPKEEKAMAEQPLKKVRVYSGGPGAGPYLCPRPGAGPNHPGEPAPATFVASPVSGIGSAGCQKATPAPALSTTAPVPTGSPCPVPYPPSSYYPYSYSYPYYYPHPYYYHYPYAYPPVGSPGLVVGAQGVAGAAPVHCRYYHDPTRAPGPGSAAPAPGPGYPYQHPYITPAKGAIVPAPSSAANAGGEALG